MKLILQIAVKMKKKSHNFCSINKDTFVIKFERSSDDIDTGIGYSTFLNGTEKYKDNIGLKCPYAVKFFEDRTFFKKKCKLK